MSSAEVANYGAFCEDCTMVPLEHVYTRNYIGTSPNKHGQNQRPKHRSVTEDEYFS